MQSNKQFINFLFLNVMDILQDVVCGAGRLYCVILTGVSIILSTPFISMRVGLVRDTPLSLSPK